MTKLLALLDVLRKGDAVANPAAWKNSALVANFLLALLGAAAAFGFKVDFSDADVQALAGGIVAAVALANGIVHVASSTRVGLPAKDPAPPTDPAQG